MWNLEERFRCYLGIPRRRPIGGCHLSEVKMLCGYWDLGAKGVAAEMGPVGADGARGSGGFTSLGGHETFDEHGRDPPAS